MTVKQSISVKTDTFQNMHSFKHSAFCGIIQ